MGTKDVEAIAGSHGNRYSWASFKSQVTAQEWQISNLSVWTKMPSLRKMKYPKVVVLLVLGLLMVALELCFEHESQLSGFLASRTRLPLVRLPNETLPRRMKPGSTVLSSAFLHENLNTSTVDLSSRLSYGEVRLYQPYGVGTHLFLHLGTYRSGPREFSTAGSIARGAEDWLHPQFGCRWVDSNGTAVDAKEVQKHRPAASFPGLYEALVVICKFNHDVGVDNHGGALWLSFWKDDKFRTPESLVALTEAPGDYHGQFEPPFPYDIVYCGSPIFGNVSAERVREWLAYHMFVMGDGAHFILYDAGGFHEAVQRVLAPWVERGRVSVQNVRQMEFYPAFYFHQRAVVNDCLFKSRFMANWTFFFDLDEYLFVDPVHHLTDLLAAQAAENVTVVKFDQKPMSVSLCDSRPSLPNATRDAVYAKLWGFEKFIFNMQWPAETHANKYAVQGRHVSVTEVHNAIQIKWGGSRDLRFKDHLWFHHFQGSIKEHGEECHDFTEAAHATWDAPIIYKNANYSADYTLANLADEVRQFEVATIGDIQPFIL